MNTYDKHNYYAGIYTHAEIKKLIWAERLNGIIATLALLLVLAHIAFHPEPLRLEPKIPMVTDTSAPAYYPPFTW